MAKTAFDLPTQIPTQLTDVAARPFYASVGVTDLVVGTVRDAVAEMQKRLDGVQKSVAGLEAKPEALRDLASKAVADGIEALNKDAVARRRAVEQRMIEIQAEVQGLPVRLQKLVDSQVATAGDTYADLVKRGETLVDRIRHQQATADTEAAAKTTVAKAKTTKTQAVKATKTAEKSVAKATKSVSSKTATKTSAAKSSAKATATSAKKTAASAVEAVADAAEKVGD